MGSEKKLLYRTKEVRRKNLGITTAESAAEKNIFREPSEGKIAFITNKREILLNEPGNRGAGQEFRSPLSDYVCMWAGCSAKRECWEDYKLSE